MYTPLCRGWAASLRLAGRLLINEMLVIPACCHLRYRRLTKKKEFGGFEISLNDPESNATSETGRRAFHDSDPIEGTPQSFC